MAITAASISASLARGATIRVSAEQVCPELRYAACTERAAAAAGSASGMTISGDLPPSSSDTRLTDCEASSMTRLPASVEPVNDTMSTSGWTAMASPTTGPTPVTRLKTPAGRPTDSTISARTNAFSGATSEGLTTTVQPAASAGATLAAIWCSG